jgi:hypothetical protein
LSQDQPEPISTIINIKKKLSKLKWHTKKPVPLYVIVKMVKCKLGFINIFSLVKNSKEQDKVL